MKILLSLLIVILSTANSFAQKLDFINAPLNPMAVTSSVAQHNLKGNVFQLNNYHFTRDGKRFLSDWQKKDEDKIEFDAMNRIVKISTYYESITDYAYDEKNRVIKEVYRDPRENWTKDYTYNQVEDILKITVKQTGGKRPSENEQHFKNGLEIQSQLKGQDARSYQYEFDKRGNWIKKTTYNMTSTTMNYGVATRDIIYYDEYDLGIKAISVVAEKFMGLVAVPKPYINSTKYNPAIDRLKNDFIFYDAFTKTYYIARDGYNANHTVGQKITVEKLLSGYETVLLTDGKTAALLEAGKKVKSFRDWKPTTYVGFIIAVDSVAKKSFAFEPIPAISDNEIIALGGKDMTDDVNKVSYLYSAEKKDLFIFEGGKSIAVTFAGLTEGDTSAVAAVNGVPRFVIPPSKISAAGVISPARYFDPAKDRFLTKKAAATPQKSASISTSALPPANNSINSSNLSTDSKNYLSVYKNNPGGVKEHLAALYNDMLQKKYPSTMISGTFAIIAKEVFPVNPDAAYQVFMKVPSGVNLIDMMSALPKNIRDEISKKARAKVATYAN